MIAVQSSITVTVREITVVWPVGFAYERCQKMAEALRKFDEENVSGCGSNELGLHVSNPEERELMRELHKQLAEVLRGAHAAFRGWPSAELTDMIGRARSREPHLPGRPHPGLEHLSAGRSER